MNTRVIIKVEEYIDRFISKCIKNNLILHDIKYINNNIIEVKIDLKDLKRIKKLNYYSKITIIKYEGLYSINTHIKNNLYNYIILIICILLINITSNIIIKVDVIHQNKTIRNLISKELINYNIKPFTLNRSFKELEQIKNKIVSSNKDKIEWMSIKKEGIKYIVRLEERKTKEYKEDLSPRNIVSIKEAEITKISSSKGEVLVRTGDTVKEGDILISGKISLYDNIKGYIPSEGTIYGKVWYEVETTIPKEEQIQVKTGNKRHNININNWIILANKYKHFYQENIKEINILFLKIKIYDEVEYKIEKIKNTKDNIDDKIKEIITEEFSNKLKDKGTIISQKVLKKEEKNSTIISRVFVITNEIISTYEYLNVGEENDT